MLRTDGGHREYFFITGMMRSGTTFLTGLVQRLPWFYAGMQTHTKLFIEGKRDFLNMRKLGSAYPLSAYFPKTYEPAEFSEHLHHTDFIARFYAALAEGVPDRTRFMGDKEVFCEEYVPFLAHEGVKCLIIVRDLRDVICSIHHGAGTSFAGDHRPWLIDIRNWRKSVAFAMLLQKHPNVLVLRFEDLVMRDVGTIDRLSGFFDVSSTTLFESLALMKPVNSSFASTIDQCNPIGRYTTILDHKQIAFLETVALPELVTMGYLDSHILYPEQVYAFKEPFKIEREAFKDFDIEAELIKEHERLQQILGNSPVQAEYFLFPNLVLIFRKMLGIICDDH